MNTFQNESTIDFVRKQFLFADLTPEELALVAHALQRQEYAPGDYIIHEDELSQDIYFIKSGEAEIIKRNQQTQQEFVINNAYAGEIVGEMAFIDGLPRSSSVRIINYPAIIYKLPVSESHSALVSIYDKILGKATQSSLSRLRTTNQNFIQNLKKKIKTVEEQNSFGYFFIFFFSLYNLTNVAGRFLLAYDVSESYWGALIIFSLFFLIPTACYLHYVHYPISDFGLTLQGMGSALKTAALMSIGGILLGGVFYYFIDRPLFYENVAYAMRSFFTWNVFAVFLYSLSSEFAIRGAILTSLQKFLFPQNKNGAAWLTACLIWPSDLYLGFKASFIDFLMDLFLGIVFLKQQNLAGVVLLRFVIIIITQYG